MRKKPPANMPNVNSGKEWSPMDLAVFQNAVANG